MNNNYKLLNSSAVQLINKVFNSSKIVTIYFAKFVIGPWVPKHLYASVTKQYSTSQRALMTRGWEGW